MLRVKIPNYKVFKTEIFSEMSSEEKNQLFYWSLIDSSSWEEVPPTYYPNSRVGHTRVIEILERSESIKSLIKKDKDYFVRRFIEGEFLANFLLAAELERRLDGSWQLDLANLHKSVFPDIIFSKKKRVSIEIKGMISASNLKNRIDDDVMPHLRKGGHNNFLLLLLFPVCLNENPDRVNQLIEGYYIYEKIMENDSNSRRVFCQCFMQDGDEDGSKFSLEKLVNRLIDNYFNKS